MAPGGIHALSRFLKQFGKGISFESLGILIEDLSRAENEPDTCVSTCVYITYESDDVAIAASINTRITSIICLIG